MCLPKLTTQAACFPIDTLERKISGKTVVKAEKGFILYEDMDVLMKIIE